LFSTTEKIYAQPNPDKPEITKNKSQIKSITRKPKRRLTINPTRKVTRPVRRANRGKGL
jgi:hypothetical protein